MNRRHAIVLLVVLLCPALVQAQSPAPGTPPETMETGPDVFRARFETTKGDFVIEVHREWAPFGADRFYNLVKQGFYDDNRIFRVRPGFIVQFGLHGDPAVQRAWLTPLRDDPVTQKNVRGAVTFTTDNRPQSRFTQIFINLDDNSNLDADGFAPFGQVVSGMETFDALFAYPRENQPDQPRILREGNKDLDQFFPELDRIERATIVAD